MQNGYNILVEKSEGKRPLGRWGDNIKIDLTEIGYEGVNWILLVPNRTQ
jgi:hypothetical protein